MVKLHLAGNNSGKALEIIDQLIGSGEAIPPYYLDSYYYCRNDTGFTPTGFKHRSAFKGYMLDSGAFTFINKTKGDVANIDFESYARDYAHFVAEHDIKNYMELDIESAVGLHKVQELRDILENITGRDAIPVWHKPRGKQTFIDLAKKYDYVAISGLTPNGLEKHEWKYFPWFIKTAHEHDAQIHNLGWTSKDVGKYGFDSVDSTSWLSAQKFGTVHQFTGSSIKQVSQGGRSKYPQNTKHNFKEWVKFARYLDE